MAMFDEANTKDGTVTQLNRNLFELSGRLPDIYGMEPRDLAYLLKE